MSTAPKSELKVDQTITILSGAFEGKTVVLKRETSRIKSVGFCGSRTVYGWLCEINYVRKGLVYKFIENSVLVYSVRNKTEKGKTNA